MSTARRTNSRRPNRSTDGIRTSRRSWRQNPRETIRLEALDWTGGQISDNDDPNEVRDVDLASPLPRRPRARRGAEPGDLLKVEFHDMGPLNDRSEFGFTGTFSQQNGGGFLTDHFPDAAKSIWEIDGYTVSSRHVPDVRYEGRSIPDSRVVRRAKSCWRSGTSGSRS